MIKSMMRNIKIMVLKRKSNYLFALFLIFYLRIYISADWDDVGTQISFFFFSPILIWIGYYLFKTRNDELWMNGIFPQKMKFSRDAMMEAHICLGALLIQKEPKNVREKTFFLVNYLRKLYPHTDYDFGESLSFSYARPIQTKTVATWLKLHLKEETKRMQVLHFLVELCSLDGMVIEQEYQILKELSQTLGLKQLQLDQVIQSFQFKQEQPKRPSFSRQDLKKSAFKILELEETTDLQVIKKAYRLMVKKHHPDRFVNESKEQQAIANERFLQIQRAYELLTS